MNTLIIYDSLYGNTEAVASAIAGALGEALPGQVETRRVSQVREAEWAEADLLVIGSPTHGALPTEAIQALLARIGPPETEGARAATFDTRLTWPFLARWGGFAAEKMADVLDDKGWTVTIEPGGFYVRGLLKGPLKAGEMERATAWGQNLAEALL